MTQPPASTVTTVSEFLRAVRPAFHDIFTADELAATTIHALDGASRAVSPWPTWPAAADDSLLDDETIVSVSTLGNTIGIWAGGGRETATEAYERVRSDLHDFVAESSFGWGQLRH